EESAEKLTPEDRQEVARGLPLFAPKYPKFLIKDGGAPAFFHPPPTPSPRLPRRLPFRQNVRKLFRGFGDARRAVRLRWHSQLRRMWMYGQQRFALDSNRKGCRSPSRRTFCGRVSRYRIAGQSSAAPR